MISTGLVVLFVAVTAAAGGVIVWGRYKPVPIRRTCAWPKAKKRIRVWGGSGIDPIALAEAVRVWKDLGWPLELALASDLHDVLVMADPLVDPRATIDDTREVHGNTVVTMIPGAPVGELPYIDRVVVTVVPRSGKLVLAHELGHALGIAHGVAAPSGYLMHSEFSRVGWDTRGLRNPDVAAT